ncbi:hypothetical protein ACI6PS_14365 [Flavobacterium sp. PLA-1-15]|uniref:hypothetical protein n=1 Tax=Flavobacterium sp. PLA-1-15 TaxID=3380533 RepID=UPI003B77602D
MKDKTTQFSEELESLKQSYDSITKAVEVIEKEKPILIEKALEGYYKQKLELMTELDKVTRRIEVLNPPKTKKYNMASSFKDKVKWVLQKHKKLLPVSYVAREINIQEGGNIKDQIAILRLTMNRMVDKEEMIRYKIEHVAGYHYGMPEWFVNGIPIQGYMF